MGFETKKNKKINKTIILKPFEHSVIIIVQVFETVIKERGERNANKL